MFQSNAFQSFAFQTIGGIASIIGGHFLPAHHKNKRTLSNVNVIYKKAQALPRLETKELRDIISEFVELSVARKAILPDIIKIDYEALEANEIAYKKFISILENIESRFKISLEEEEELLLMATIASIIH